VGVAVDEAGHHDATSPGDRVYRSVGCDDFLPRTDGDDGVAGNGYGTIVVTGPRLVHRQHPSPGNHQVDVFHASLNHYDLDTSF